MFRFRGLSCKPNNHVSWSISELRVRLARCETGLSPPVNYFTDRSKAMLLLWIFMLFLSCFCYAFVCVCLLMPWGHLLGKGWPLGSLLWCLIVKLSLSSWYLGSGVVLDCIDSWSLPFFYVNRNRKSFKTQKSYIFDYCKVIKKLIYWKSRLIRPCVISKPSVYRSTGIL